MTVGNWIVVSKSFLWAAALRQTLAQLPARGADVYRVREFRRQQEARTALSDYPTGLLAMEFCAVDLERSLDWFRATLGQFHRARAVALWHPSLREAQDKSLLAEVESALREAGAAEIAMSPRQLGAVVEIGFRHFLQVERGELERPEDPAQAVWQTLPWQPPSRPLG